MVLVWIARAIILLLVLRIVLRLLFGARQMPRTRQTPPKEAGGERVGGELVRCANCGTYFPKARAIALGAGSDVKYFCSQECRDAYDAKLRHA